VIGNRVTKASTLAYTQAETGALKRLKVKTVRNYKIWKIRSSGQQKRLRIRKRKPARERAGGEFDEMLKTMQSLFLLNIF